MIQLMYISTAKADIDETELAKILAVSRRNNRRDDITGLLVKGGRRFLQALEGPEESVHRTYERIRQDARHQAIVRLDESPIERRRFSDWTMGFRFGGADWPGNELETIVATLVQPIEDAGLKAHFLGFAKLHRTAA